MKTILSIIFLFLTQDQTLLQKIKADPDYIVYMDTQVKIRDGFRSKRFVFPPNAAELLKNELKVVDEQVWINTYKKAGMVNPTLEAAMLKIINEYAQSNGWKEKFTKLKITDKDWYINRNQYSGRILSRSINVYAQGNWPDGHCTGVEFSILQQYDGTKYSSNCLYNGIGKTDKIDCN